MSWISINDVVGIIDTLLNDDSLSGAYNLVAPQPVTNAVFTKCLGRAVNRPTFFPMPEFVARSLFGEMADALLLSSSRVASKRLQEIPYTFIDTELEATLKGLLKNNR